MKYILHRDIFNEDEELYDNYNAKAEVQLEYSEAELDGQGKRSVDKKFEIITEVQTPNKSVTKVLDLLPKNVWCQDTRFLDPACKNGEFLKAIMNKLLKSENYRGTLLKDKAKRLNYIMSRQIYGIALTEKSLQSTLENLGTTERCCNIIQINNYNYEIKLSKDRKLLAKEIKERLGLEGEMRFNVVVGNPPYQSTGGTSSIYQNFIDLAIKLKADHISMITRDNWLTAMEFEKTRKNLLDAGNVDKVYHYPIVGEVFNDIGVAVTYFVWNKDAENVGTRYIRIEDKVVTSNRMINIKRFIASDISNEIVSKIKVDKDWGTTFKSRSYPFMDQRKRYRIQEENSSYISDEYYNVKLKSNK